MENENHNCNGTEAVPASKKDTCWEGPPKQAISAMSNAAGCFPTPPPKPRNLRERLLFWLLSKITIPPIICATQPGDRKPPSTINPTKD